MTKAHSYLASGALAILMSSASAFAMPASSISPQISPASRAAIVLAQAEQGAEQQEGEPRRPRRQRDAEQPAAQAEEPAPRRQRQAEQPAEQTEQPSAEQPAEAPAEPKPRRQRQAEQPAEQTEQPSAEQPAEAPAEPKPRRQRQAEQPAEQTEQPSAEQPAEAPAEPKPRRQRQAEQPSEQTEPSAGQPAEAPAEPKPRRQRQAEQPAEQTEQPSAEQPAEAPAEPKPRRQAEQPAEQTEQPSAEQPAETPAEPNAGRPAQQAEEPTRDRPSEASEATPLDGSKAPVLDSAKPAEGEGERRRPRRDQQPQGEQTAQPPAAPAGPPPADDSAAQEAAQPAEIVPVTRERGERRRERPDREQRERPEGVEVLRKLGDRIILNFNNRPFVESDDRDRMGRGARDVYYEDLPRGRTREVVTRPNGSQVVTIRDRNGDIIRRSRIMPDGREYVLNYVDEANFDRVREWRDPGDDLPPMRLDIPEDEYILDAEGVETPDAYYDFLREPPVEKVERLYSVDEVKRSARIRDKTRRVDLDTITFEFGKAEVPESQVQRLEGVAQAMEKLLAQNPAESFLIEGHTDAVGTDVANLALSDRRAEAVADALTNVFGIPPENLATQGYGEQYLKVRTSEPERQNRRVAIRRITPLVAPVASAQ